MGISHSMNHDQINRVLSQFEATTQAIQGIEQKATRMQGYIGEMKGQRVRITQQAEAISRLVDNMSDSLNNRSDDFIEFFQKSCAQFAIPIEQLEVTFANMGFQDAPRQMRRELGPLIVPAIVLVLIICCTNTWFGFLLATDAALSDQFSLEFGERWPNALQMFASFRVGLIGASLLYLVMEVIRRGFRRREVRKRKGQRLTFMEGFLHDWLSPEDENDSSDRDSIEPAKGSREHDRASMDKSDSSNSGALVAARPARGSREHDRASMEKSDSSNSGALVAARRQELLRKGYSPNQEYRSASRQPGFTSEGPLPKSDEGDEGIRQVTSTEMAEECLPPVAHEAQANAPMVGSDKSVKLAALTASGPQSQRLHNGSTCEEGGLANGMGEDIAAWHGHEPKPSSSSSQVGATVAAISGRATFAKDYAGVRRAWHLPQGGQATVIEVDRDGDIRLINAEGVKSGWVRGSAFAKLEDGAALVGVTEVDESDYWASQIAGGGTSSENPGRRGSESKGTSSAAMPKRLPRRSQRTVVERNGVASPAPISKILRRLEGIAAGKREAHGTSTIHRLSSAVMSKTSSMGNTGDKADTSRRQRSAYPAASTSMVGSSMSSR